MKKLYILILLFLISLTVTMANPLYVNYVEKVNVTGNTTGDGVVNIKNFNVTGYLIINNSATGANDTLFDVWIGLNTSNIIGIETYENPKDINWSIKSSAPSYVNINGANEYIYIPTLPYNTYLILKFIVNTSNVGNPIIINETYDTDRVPAETNATWNVTVNISRNVSALPSTDTPINIVYYKYLSNDINNYGDGNWTLLKINNSVSNSGTITLFDSPYFSGNTNDSLKWNTILNSTQNGSLIMQIIGFYNNSGNRSLLLTNFGFSVLKFNFTGTLSGTEVKGVYATGDLKIQAFKKGPYKNSVTGKYEIWYERANVTNYANSYSFNVTSLTMWAVNGSNPATLDPFNPTLLITGSNYTFTPGVLNPNDYYNTPEESFSFLGIPVIWANISARLVDSNITLINETINEENSYGGSYLTIEKIYIIGSYLLKVTKHVIPVANSTYEIYIVLENIGPKKTPEYVYVYDLIPNNFTMYDVWVNKSSMLIINNGNNVSGTNPVSSPLYNYSVYWALHSLNGGADGDGSYTDYTEIANNQTVVIHYMLNGTGTYYPSNLFIVGVDPRNSLLPTTSPKTVILAGAIMNNFETLLALISALLGVTYLIRRN